MRRFPLSLRPSPLPFTDQGSTPGPLSLFCATALCKSCRIRLSRILGWFAGFRLGVFSRLWNSAGCVRIWLGAFGKKRLFRCQSSPVPLSLFCATALCKSSRIRLSRILGWFAGFRLGVFSRLLKPAGCVRIWLEGLSKEGLFGCQSAHGPPI